MVSPDVYFFAVYRRWWNSEVMRLIDLVKANLQGLPVKFCQVSSAFDRVSNAASDQLYRNGTTDNSGYACSLQFQLR